MYLSASTLALILPLVVAKTITVNVGQNGLKFDPENIAAKKGDILEFHYFPKKHSVTQSSFAAPCVPIEGAINSGFVPTSGESPTTFSVTVADDTKPLWFYCAQTTGNHCQAGMSMVVNEPKDPAKSLVAYKEAAAKLISPSQISDGTNGGTLANGTAPASPSGSGLAIGGAGTAPGNGTVHSGSPSATSSSTSATSTNSIAKPNEGTAGSVINWAIIGGAALAGAFAL